MDIEKTIREYLPQVIHMSLATTKNNKPWVCEVHFAYDDALNLYFRSLASRRHSQEIAENPSVAGNIIKQHSLEEYPLGVYFEGMAEMMQPGDELDKAAKLIKERLHIT
ncbi:MAG: pyridoxamine 5'-phosphate oxidase family protein, partial [Patescibacteria group bacterium]